MIIMISDFKSDNTKGERAEIIAHKIVLLNGYIRFMDVSKNKEYQEKDIDFLALKANRKKCDSFEVKNRTSISKPEIFAELELIYPKYVTSGWIYKSEAKYIIYRIEKLNISYLFKLDDLIAYLTAHRFTLNKHITDDKAPDGKVIKRVVYSIIDIYDFAIEYPVYAFTDEGVLIGQL